MAAFPGAWQVYGLEYNAAELASGVVQAHKSKWSTSEQWLSKNQETCLRISSHIGQPLLYLHHAPWSTLQMPELHFIWVILATHFPAQQETGFISSPKKLKSKTLSPFLFVNSQRKTFPLGAHCCFATLFLAFQQDY